MFRIILILSLVFTESNQEPKFLLSGGFLGDLDLISLKHDRLKDQILEVFPNFTIEKNIGQQDGPDYIFYSVKDQGDELFVVRLDGNDSTLIDEVWISSSRIEDQNGLSIGSKLEDLQKEIKDLRLNADFHQNVYASAPFSRLSYRLKVRSFQMLNDSTMLASDFSVKFWQIGNCEVEYIIWR